MCHDYQATPLHHIESASSSGALIVTVHAQYGNGLNGWEGCDIGDLWCCNEEEEQVIKEGVDSKREHYLLRALEYRYSRVSYGTGPMA